MKEFESKKNMLNISDCFSDADFLKQIDAIIQEKKQTLHLEFHN
ncbi:hypothetical protein OIU83_06680 [Flavobacterium sp. LS1R49]|uniref:Uncharacterized protein n=1 Tax=Flavobacterium shii TaxID=2987687 RepID=A0A9X3C6V8_9FLAO|nr:hypothetical protein [Flavobacterium shii]MCV9927328.1 hypothetical protein [Flavobacterium shii]